MRIRTEKEHDHAAAGALLRAAFGGEEEVELVRCLRGTPDYLPELALLLEEEGDLLASLYFTPVTLPPGDGRFLALAPMAVRPGKQGQGLGSRLLRAGLEKARRLGYDAVFVLGHPAYYPRFGFRPAAQWGIGFPAEVPDAAFMALPLRDGALDNRRGTLVYAPCFGLES